MSPISSRNSVPPSARDKAPRRSWRASVNAPRTAPNSSLSSSVSGIAPQLIATNGPEGRSPRSWIDCATSSLPLPLSPRISTGTVSGATRAMALYISIIDAWTPMMRDAVGSSTGADGVAVRRAAAATRSISSLRSKGFAK